MSRIPKVLKEKGINQAQLAVAHGVSKPCISQFCFGKVDVPATKLTAMFIAYLDQYVPNKQQIKA
jgi:predicted transcriptional regulator